MKNGGRTLVIKVTSFGGPINPEACRHFLWKLLEMLPEKTDELLDHLKQHPGVGIQFAPLGEDGKPETSQEILGALASMISVLDGISCTVQTTKIWK